MVINLISCSIGPQNTQQPHGFTMIMKDDPFLVMHWNTTR